MTPTQSLGNPLLATCIFCERDEGCIEGALDQVAALPPNPRMVDINLNDRHGPKLLEFGREAKRTRPCRHAVDLSINGEVMQTGNREADRTSFNAQWLHPWLARNDPQEELLQFVWALEDGEADECFRPASKFSLTRLHDCGDIQVRVPNPSRVITFSGDVLMAAEPSKFLRELQACFRRYVQQSAQSGRFNKENKR